MRRYGIDVALSVGPIAAAYSRDAVGNPLAIRERDDILYYGYDGAYRLTKEQRLGQRRWHGLRGRLYLRRSGQPAYARAQGLDARRPARQPAGWWPLDEIRPASFTPPTTAFAADGNAMALYHLDEQSLSESADDCSSNNNDGTFIGEPLVNQGVTGTSNGDSYYFFAHTGRGPGPTYFFRFGGVAESC